MLSYLAREKGRRLLRGRCCAVYPPMLRSCFSNGFNLTPGLPGVPLLPLTNAHKDQVTIDVGSFTGDYELNDVSDFGTSLISTVMALKNAGKSVCYLEVPLDFCHYIPIAAVNGFAFHNARGRAATLSMTLHPPNDNGISPANPFTHEIYLQTLLLRENDESESERNILVVKDGVESFSIPRGPVYIGEDFTEASTRIVREHAGIDSTFRYFVSLLHDRGGPSNYSCIHLTALLSAVSYEVKDGVEWMPLNDAKLHGIFPQHGVDTNKLYNFKDVLA